MNKTVICCLLALIFSPCGAAPLGEGAFDMISISADEASEDEQPGILNFRGNFLMQSSDWQLTSTQATVYGSPNKPDRVHLEGSPARFMIHKANNPDEDSIEAAASVVEYLRDSNTLKLSGNATLKLGNEVIRSADIEYDIGSNRYQAGGTDGVLIEVPPVGISVSPLVGH
jgi:lipopolysaccharide transport protein LptA